MYHRCQFRDISLYFIEASLQMPPLWSLGLGGSVFLQRYHPYGIQEGFEVFKVSASYPVRLGNRTYRTWESRRLFFLKLTLMVRFQTAPTGPGGPKQVAYGRVHRKIGRKNWKLNDSAPLSKHIYY